MQATSNQDRDSDFLDDFMWMKPAKYQKSCGSLSWTRATVVSSSLRSW
jgi:hypothetical protein